MDLTSNFSNIELKNSQVEINCTIHSYSYFVEGNLNNVSIIQEMCLIYNSLFNLNFTFTNSFIKNYSNLTNEELPLINYGNLEIKRNYINNFLKELVGLNEIKKEKLEHNFNSSTNSEEEIKFQIEILEKIILSDLQLALNFYNYIHHYEKTRYIWKFFKFLYQPLIMFKSSFYERKLILEITRQLGISTKYEALEYISKIFKKIENFLILFEGEEFCKNLQNRELNSIDILIYSAVKAVNRIISKNKIENFGLKSFKIVEMLCKNFDYLISNKLEIKNKFKILLPQDFSIVKKPNKNLSLYTYKNYKETNFIADKNRNQLRKSFLSIFYFGSLLFLSLTYTKSYTSK